MVPLDRRQLDPFRPRADTGHFRTRPASGSARQPRPGEQRQLAKTETLETNVIPGQLSGNFAVWSVCRDRRDGALCDTYLYDVANATTTKLPLGGARSQFSASVTAAGVVYLVRSNGGCGDAARLVRYERGADAETLMHFPRGTESFRSSAFERDTGETEIYFERSRCSSGRGDVVRVIDKR